MVVRALQGNPAINDFMAKKAPVTEAPLVMSTFDESKSNINYPKDLKGCVLMCARATTTMAHPRRAQGVPRISLTARWPRRKNKVMRMSYRAPDDPVKVPQGERISYKAKPSSDVTKGFEGIYARSYY